MSEHEQYVEDIGLVDDTAHKAWGGIDTVEDWEKALEACQRIVAYKKHSKSSK